MNKKYLNVKMVINNKEEMELMMSMLTSVAFHAKFTLSMGLTSKLLADKAMAHAAFTDVSPVYMAKHGKTPMN